MMTVLIVPAKSFIPSRKTVELNKAVSFGQQFETEFRGVPVMAANMDGVGTFAVADACGNIGFSLASPNSTLSKV